MMKSFTITRPVGFLLPLANDKQHSRLKTPPPNRGNSNVITLSLL